MLRFLHLLELAVWFIIHRYILYSESHFTTVTSSSILYGFVLHISLSSVAKILYRTDHNCSFLPPAGSMTGDDHKRPLPPGCQLSPSVRTTVMRIAYVALQLYLHDKFCKRIPWHLHVCNSLYISCKKTVRVNVHHFQPCETSFVYKVPKIFFVSCKLYCLPITIMHPDRVLVWERDSCCSSKTNLLTTLLTWSKHREFSGNGPRSMRPFELRALDRISIKYRCWIYHL